MLSAYSHLPHIHDLRQIVLCLRNSYSITTRGVSSMTFSPCFTHIAVTFPLFSACRLFAIFMASRTTTVSPSFTSSPTATHISVITPGSGAFRALAVFTLAPDDACSLFSASALATCLSTTFYSGFGSSSISTL